ncbi:MAG: hypothetical protein AB1816_19195 [Bacillota bacterium]
MALPALSGVGEGGHTGMNTPTDSCLVAFAWHVEMLGRRVQQLQADLRDLGRVSAEEKPVVAGIVLEALADLEQRVKCLRCYWPLLGALMKEGQVWG